MGPIQVKFRGVIAPMYINNLFCGLYTLLKNQLTLTAINYIENDSK